MRKARGPESAGAETGFIKVTLLLEFMEEYKPTTKEPKLCPTTCEVLFTPTSIRNCSSQFA